MRAVTGEGAGLLLWQQGEGRGRQGAEGAVPRDRVVTHGAIDRRARQRDVIGAIARFGMGLRRAMAIEQLESGARTERYALVVGVGEVELSVHYHAKLHMADPAVVETRLRCSADNIVEGAAVVAGAGKRLREILALATGPPH